MNGTQITNTLTPLFAAVAGFLAGKGYFGFDAQSWLSILGAIGALGASVWGAWSTRNNSIINQAAVLPEVDTIIATPAAATAAPATNVVSNATNTVVKT